MKHNKNPSSNKRNHSKHKGMQLESDLNLSNQNYIHLDLAIIHKKPTPIQVVSVDYANRSSVRITEAYYNIPSTTDYCGIYKGYYIDFEAKETSSLTRFDFSLIHQHQYDHLIHVYQHGAIAFLVVRFTQLNKDVLIAIKDIEMFRKQNSRASLPMEWIDTHGYLIAYHYKRPCDYLKAVDRLMIKEKLNENF